MGSGEEEEERITSLLVYVLTWVLPKLQEGTGRVPATSPDVGHRGPNTDLTLLPVPPTGDHFLHPLEN